MKLLLWCVRIEGKQVTGMRGSKIEIQDANPSDVMDLHGATSEALSHIMDDQGKENYRIK